MKTYELINPSDAITFQGDDLVAAGVAIILLGRGAFGLTDEKGEQAVPLMLFGGIDDWLAKNNIKDMAQYIADNTDAIADFLETVCYGSLDERLAFDEACKRMTPEKAAEHREWWNDRKRSSMNNIGAGALRLAKQLRKKKPVKELKGSPPIILAKR